MAEPQAQPAPQPTGAPAPGQPEPSVSEQWARAQAVAEAKERAEGIVPEPRGGAAEGDDAPELTQKQKAEAKARALAKRGGKPDDEGDEDEQQAAREAEGKVTPQERIKFRENKRRAYEKLENERRDFVAERTALQTKYSKYEQAEAAVAAGDDEAAIQAIFGCDLNTFQKRAVDRVRGRDPRVERLEREQRELKQELAQREAKEKADREAAQLERERHEWTTGLSAELVKHEDPKIAKLATFTEFVNGLKLPGVFDAQAQSFDGDDHASAEEAALEVIPMYEALYKALHSVFGEQDASIPDASKGATSRSGPASAKPVPKGTKKAIAQRSAAEASPTNGKGVDDQALIARYAQRIAESHD